MTPAPTKKPTRDEVQKEAFISAVRLGYPQLLSAVLDSDDFPPNHVQLNVIDGNQTALMWAARKGWLSIARLLNEKGLACVNVASPSGLTALMIACWKGHDEMVAFLLGKGANPGKACHKGKTALIYASEHGHTRCVQRLLEAGLEKVRINDADKSGNTALAYACLEGHAEVAWLLVLKGRAKSLLTAQQTAEVRARGNLECLEVIKVSRCDSTASALELRVCQADFDSDFHRRWVHNWRH
jgi:ankyrin repeat protein